ncbi:lipid IV(A) 3-deoxy-D-manno-octulosonic acid transferase [Kingella negevensis]|uniref:lipid IV(A) 3-deoxy-D-manno-octulosonic acid transferase n=1 Tax=Kingella negevensis TaxID=1522312 RepID=UPI000A26DF84|nr:lipid IV(A) 3-deoxy-D-manno-octulosonic acid transferase [Kingella negevensis]MDK4688410.1 lipid IV(A) 3-deoxy-D-manno-octulosonic acid transferase [Kingella negevensis]WII90330.1 lipid IV(A) 3-deoxy-D-manno-octulosonic acid transferase [Kingella negevensis]
MLTTLYNALWHIAPPIIKHYLRKRAQKNPDYLKHWDERFGSAYLNPVQRPIWLHTVSVGETRAAQPLIAALQERFPNAPLLLTQMTPTGRATAEQLYPQAQCRYLPYDRRDWVQQFMREHQPIAGIIMETEIWANLFQAANQAHVPLFLANARLSQKSAQGYQKAQSLVQPALATLSGCLAQTPADAERLAQIGAANVQVCGNTKYDITPPEHVQTLAQTFRQRIGERPIFLAASTREKNGVDETELILRAWQNVPQNALLVIVPRHPERFQAAFDCAVQLGFRAQKRSDNQPLQPETQVWIGDSMGEMFAYYQAADIAFVGGSLIDTGCQNIIEPMACGKPVLFGQSVYNFQAACEGALAAGAAVQVNSAEELVQTVSQWIGNPQQYADFAQHATQFVAQHQGASERMAEIIAAHIQAA